jgi:AAA family ATPase
MGISNPKGILLYGPPGCSKTLIARAVASDSRFNFLHVKGAEILSQYVGESERQLRDIFNKARAAFPCVLFFDEIDAIGSRSSHSGIHLVQTLLTEMDGLEVMKDVLILAATNAPERLDPALLRSGRMDRILYVGPPNLDARYQILKINAKGRPISDNVNLLNLAERMDGHTGAEIVRISQEAADLAMDAWEEGDHLGKPLICREHFETAMERTPRIVTSEMRARFEQWLPGEATKLL